MAQNGGYAKGNKLLNIGIGVNSYYNGGIPFGASFEVGVTDEISVGGNFDYLSNKYSGYGYSWKFTALYIGARGSYHFNELLNINNEKIDLYGGATIGYRSFKWKDNFDESYYSVGGTYGNGVYVGAFAGGKYYFNSKIGAFVELGAIGSTNARLGIGFKF
jgi:hypothetical protein